MAGCSICGGERAAGHCYCLAHKAAYMREWRKENRLNAEQRRKANSRRHARVYQERGKLVPRPCEVCGGAAEKHHVDYDQPLNVRWLCRPHHLDHHRQEAPAATSDGLDRLEATLTSLGM